MNKTITEHLVHQRQKSSEPIEIVELEEKMDLLSFVGMSAGKSSTEYRSVAFRDTSGKAAYPVMLSKELSPDMSKKIVAAIKKILTGK